MRTTILREYPWIKEVLDRPVNERRFIVEKDNTVKEPTEGVQYYIFIGYRFQPPRDFHKPEDYPRLPGVYRLFKNKEVVRIGESNNLEVRLKEHLCSYNDKVDKYDFVEIHDVAARKIEEKRLLEKFKDAYGRLPKLNSIIK